jgi:DUF4097 and DUF4098 domain-containing protein YvlB
MKVPAMRVTRSLIVSFCTLLATGATAQSAFPPAVPVAPSSAVTPHGAWFERFQESRSGPESSDRWTRTFKVGPSGSLDLSNISGDIVITGGSGDEIRVEAVKSVRGRDTAETKRHLDAVTIDATERAGRVEISTTYPRSQNNISVDVDYTVQVPAQTSVSIRSVSGDLQLTGVKGEARLETVSGSVITSNSGQLARVKSVSGDVSVADGGSGDVLSLGTVSGNLVAKRLKARSLELQTVSGDVLLTDTICDRVLAKSVSGDVHFGGPFAKAGRYEFNTHSGDVRVAVQGGAGFEITANSFSGDLRSDLPLAGRGNAAAEPAGDDGRHHGPRRQELRGTFGDGSALVTVQTFSGDVLVTGGDKAAVQKDKDRD